MDGLTCSFANEGCQEILPNSRGKETHERFCGWNPNKLSEREEIGIKCVYCDSYALDHPGRHLFDDHDDQGNDSFLWAYSHQDADRMMQEHVNSCHGQKPSNVFKCLSPVCDRYYYNLSQLDAHMEVCQFKDHVRCDKCGYHDPPWRKEYHTCRQVETIFPTFENVDKDGILVFFGAKSIDDLKRHHQNMHVLRAQQTLLRDPTRSLMGGPSTMKEEFQQLVSSAFVLMCVPGQAIMHAIVEPCYATKVTFKDSVDQYGFLTDLKGLKAQVAKWRSVAEEYNVANDGNGKRISMSLFDDLSSKPSTASMWNAAFEMYCHATKILSYDERDSVSLMKMEPSGHQKGGNGFGKAATLNAEELSLQPNAMSVRSSPPRLKIKLPKGWKYPVGSKVCFWECDKNGKVISNERRRHIITDQPMEVRDQVLRMTVAKRKRDAEDDDEDTFVYGRFFGRLSASEEFDYEFDGVTLRVVVQVDKTCIDEEFVVPLPINFSHAHMLLLVGIDEGNDSHEQVSTDVNKYLIGEVGLCMKDYNESMDFFKARQCQIFKPTDLSFIYQHLQSTVGYFTKVNVHGGGKEKMDAEGFRSFSSQHGLKMTSMLVHKCKILNYNAPLMLMPPPNQKNSTFVHQSQPSQDIRNGVQSIQSAHQRALSALLSMVDSLLHDNGNVQPFQRFGKPIESTLEEEKEGDDEEDEAAPVNDRVPIRVEGEGSGNYRNYPYRCCYCEQGCKEIWRKDVMEKHISRCGFCPDNRDEWFATTFPGSNVSSSPFVCEVDGCLWVLNDRRVKTEDEAQSKRNAHDRVYHPRSIEQPVKLWNDETDKPIWICGFVKCNFYKSGHKDNRRDMREHMKGCGYDDVKDIDARRQAHGGAGVCHEQGCGWVAKAKSGHFKTIQNIKAALSHHMEAEHPEDE